MHFSKFGIGRLLQNSIPKNFPLKSRASGFRAISAVTGIKKDPEKADALLKLASQSYGMRLSAEDVERVGGVETMSKILGKSLVVFDGHCVMCDHTVMALMKADRSKRLVFCPNKDERSGALLRTLGHLRVQQREPEAVPPGWFETHRDDSIIVMGPDGAVHVHSAAAIAIGAAIGGLHYLHILARAAQQLMPAPVRDAAYRAVGRNRYSVFGKMAECRMPSKEDRERYL